MPSAAKIEPQHGKSKAAQGLHGIEDNFVVHRAAEKRVRMAH
jgi:hypothetical protein